MTKLPDAHLRDLAALAVMVTLRLSGAWLTPAQVAGEAYAQADAMLLARNAPAPACAAGPCGQPAAEPPPF